MTNGDLYFESVSAHGKHTHAVLSHSLIGPCVFQVVDAAAGAVGSLVVQIGKILGAKVVGICGSDEKCHWLVHTLKLDGAINYHTENIDGSI